MSSGDQSVPVPIVHTKSVERIVDPGFDNSGSWLTQGGWEVNGLGKAIFTAGVGTGATYQNDYVFLEGTTIHAEVEGIVCADLFVQLLQQAKQQNIQFVPLGELLNIVNINDLPDGQIVNKPMPGREGWLSIQQNDIELV